MRSFIGFGQKQYIGTPQALPIKLAGISNVVVSLLFQWLAYGAATATPNINVLVDLQTAPCKALDQIRSVYVDNLGSDNPIYVYFPDTNYTVVAKPNSEGWYPAFTNIKYFWVIGEGFLTGDIGQTSVIVSNVPQIPNVNIEIDQALSMWLASPQISRGNSIYSSRYGNPALGDQTISYVPTITTGVLINNLWGTPYPSGFLYLNSIFLQGSNFQTIAATDGTINFVIESTGVSGTIYQFNYQFPKSTIIPIVQFISQTGMNIKLAANETWRMRGIVAQNFSLNPTMQCSFNFTQQP